MDVQGGERDTMLDALRQMRSADVTGARCGICFLIGPPPKTPTHALQLSYNLVSTVIVSYRQIHQVVRLCVSPLRRRLRSNDLRPNEEIHELSLCVIIRIH